MTPAVDGSTRRNLSSFEAVVVAPAPTGDLLACTFSFCEKVGEGNGIVSNDPRRQAELTCSWPSYTSSSA